MGDQGAAAAGPVDSEPVVEALKSSGELERLRQQTIDRLEHDVSRGRGVVTPCCRAVLHGGAWTGLGGRAAWSEAYSACSMRHALGSAAPSVAATAACSPVHSLPCCRPLPLRAQPTRQVELRNLVEDRVRHSSAFRDFQPGRHRRKDLQDDLNADLA